jgi:hypothetical protein
LIKPDNPEIFGDAGSVDHNFFEDFKVVEGFSRTHSHGG